MMPLLNEPPNIQAVLDRSALRSYTRGHVNVAELLIDVANDGASIAVPTVALMDAYAQSLGDWHATALLNLIIALPGIAVMDLDAKAASAAAEEAPWSEGDLSRSHAVWAAKIHNAYYLTTEPAEVADLLPPGQIHVIPDKDA